MKNVGYLLLSILIINSSMQCMEQAFTPSKTKNYAQLQFTNIPNTIINTNPLPIYTANRLNVHTTHNQQQHLAVIQPSASASTIHNTCRTFQEQGRMDNLTQYKQRLEKHIASKPWVWVRIRLETELATVNSFIQAPITERLAVIRTGTLKDAEITIDTISKNWPYNITHAPDSKEQQQIQNYLKNVGFNELHAAQQLFRERSDYPVWLQQKAAQTNPNVESQTQQQINIPSNYPIEHTIDIVSTSPTNIINISPEIDAHVEQILNTIKNKHPEDFTAYMNAISIILNDMHKQGLLTAHASIDTIKNTKIPLQKFIQTSRTSIHNATAFIINTVRHVGDVMCSSPLTEQEIIEYRNNVTASLNILEQSTDLNTTSAYEYTGMIIDMAITAYQIVAAIKNAPPIPTTNPIVRLLQTITPRFIVQLGSSASHGIQRISNFAWSYLPSRLSTSPARIEAPQNNSLETPLLAEELAQSMVMKSSTENKISGAKEVVKNTQAEYTFTKSADKHLNEIVKHGKHAGELARPYMNSPLTIQEIIATGKGIPDKTAKNALSFKVPGTFRGSQGTWELVIDIEKKIIYHFNFVS